MNRTLNLLGRWALFALTGFTPGVGPVDIQLTIEGVPCRHCGGGRDVRPYDTEMLCSTCRAIAMAKDNVSEPAPASEKRPA